MKCPKCGHEHNNKFCPECGTPAPPAVAKCPKCGIVHGNKFCPNCGTPIVNSPVIAAPLKRMGQPQQKLISPISMIIIVSCVVIVCIFILIVGNSFDSSSIYKAVDAYVKPNVVEETYAYVLPFELKAGQYVVGDDIQPGKYDVTVMSGTGNFMGSVASCELGMLNEVLAAYGNDYGFSSSYSNLKLNAGDDITITGSLSLYFTSKS